MDPSILIIILFLLAPLIERILKAGKPPQEPPEQQRPRQQPRAQQRPVERAPAPRPAPGGDEGEDSAAAMLPDDLWEILTGERRTLEPRAQLPDTSADEPTSFEDQEEHSFEAEYSPGFEAEYESDFEGETYSAEPVEIEPYVHRPPVREAPEVVSLEATSFDSKLRHDQFHQRLEDLPPAARIRRRKPTRAAGMLDDDDLRRAIIMKEVLGPPRGLQ